MMMLSLIAILFLIVFVISTSNHATAGIPNVTQSIDTLRQRYALGEIDANELHELKKPLENSGKR